jgi:putative membrane protein
MLYTNYYWGMGLVWWVLWIILIIWIFAIPYDIPGQRNQKRSAFDVLQKRFAAGEISTNEYNEMKKILEVDLGK